MHKHLQSIVRSIDSFTEWTGRTVSWLSLVMVLISCVVVLFRYGLDGGSIAMQESVSYFHAMVFLLGAAYTLKHNGHVRVDIFYNRLSVNGQRLIDIGGTLLLLFPVALFILWSSWGEVLKSWQLKEASREAGGLPTVYLLRAMIIPFCITLILQGIAEIIKNLLLLLAAVSDPVDQATQEGL